MSTRVQQESTAGTERESRAGFLRALLSNPTRSVGIVMVASLAATVCGCRVVEETGKLPMTAVSAVVPGAKSSQPDPGALQTEIQRFSDEFVNRTIVALEDYARIVGTAAATNQALAWKLSVASASFDIASGPNPTANLLDFLAFATATRMALEEDSSKSPEGKAFLPWLDTSRILETNAWNLSKGIFKPEQQQELRDVIGEWWRANATARVGFFGRPEQFTALIRKSGEKGGRPDSVFGVIGLDPTAGLDPAVREVTRTRLFAERALFTAQRMPLLLRWQIELLTDQLLHDPQIAMTLTNASSLTRSADRFSRAAESASETASQLPDRITAERKAILDALEAQEGRLRELSADVTRTLSTGEKMSTSLNTTLTTFDALMKRFGVGEPSSEPPDTNSPPFNILDYAQTAERIATMAQQLDALVKDVGGTVDSPAINKRLEDVSALADRATANAKSVLNHAFLLGAGLVVLAFACALVYRRMGRRDPSTRGGGSPPGATP